MIHGTTDRVRYVPVFQGNDKDQFPATVDILVMSAEKQQEFAMLEPEKRRYDTDIFRFAVKGFKGITDADGNELETVDDIIAMPGLGGLIKEVVVEFVRLNTFEGEQKNAPELSTV